MKKFLLFLLAICPMVIYSQIKVQSTGQVGIGDTIHSENKLTLLASGAYESGITAISYSSKAWGPAIWAKSIFRDNRQVALMAYASNSEPKDSGRSYGVLATAGNRTPGYNYGVYGILCGSNYGAGIVGAVGWALPRIYGMYAGFFSGDVYVTNTITAQTITTLSDARYKSDVRSVESDALTKVCSLNPVQYTMQAGDAIAFANTPIDSDTASVAVQMLPQLTINDTVTHYGLLAQEVKEIYPNLVYEDAAGVMSINYIELIPLLIQAVQDLSEEVSVLRKESNSIVSNRSNK